MHSPSSTQSSPRPASAAVFGSLWALGRIFALLGLVFLLRHPLLNAIEAAFDIAGITEFAIHRAATPLTRLLLAIFAGTGYFVMAKIIARIFPKPAYLISVILAGLLTAAFTWWVGASLLVAGFVTLILVTNWARFSSLARVGLGNSMLSRVIAIPPVVAELFFASRFLDWAGSLLRREAPAPHAEVPRVWPGALLAALALSGLIPGNKLIRAEQKMRSGPDVRVFAVNDFNDLAFNARANRLLVTGHGVARVLAYNAADLTERPIKADVETGFAQSFEFDPVNQELYIYNAQTEEILVLDAGTLARKRAVPAPDISPGDSWIRFCRHSGVLAIASEADEQSGDPFVMFDGPSGAVLEKPDMEPGNLLLHPDKPILYANFFRRTCGVVAFDLTTRKVVAEGPADERTDRMTFDPVHQELLMSSPAEGRVLRFDALTLAPKGAIKAIAGVRVVAVDAPNDEMLVGSLITGKVALMGLSDHKVKRSWYLGPWLRSIVIAPGTGTAYVSSQKSLYELRYAHRN